MKNRRRKAQAAISSQTAECLELRRMLTAEITAEVVNGQLNIVEEGAQVEDAEVEVMYIRGMDGVIVQGLNGTQINGQTSEFFQLQGANSIHVDLGSGNDILRMFSYDGNSMPLNALNIDMGSDVQSENDNDVVVLEDIFAVNVNVLTAGVGEDVDNVTLNRIEASEQLTISTGNMDDVVTLEDCTTGEMLLETDGGFSRYDSGNDDVVISRLTARGEVTVNTSGGDADVDQDSINGEDITVLDSLFIKLGDDNLDNISIDRLSVDKDLMIAGGEGVDVIDLDQVKVGRNLLISTEGDNDWLSITNARIYNWMIMETGNEEDTVRIDRLFAQGLNIRLGEDDDVLTVDNSAAVWGSIDGGPGNNTLNRGKMLWLRQGGFKNF